MNETTSGARRQARMSRRAVLAAGGTLGVAGLAGCTDTIKGVIGDAAEASVVNKHATPAAFYGGSSRPTGSHWETDYTVEDVPLTVSGAFEGVDASIELTAYVTNSQLRVNNHNTTRSNRYELSRGPTGGGGSGDGTLVTVLGLEYGLRDQIEPAMTAVGNVSKADAKRALEGFAYTIEQIQGHLEGCTSDVCGTVRENADARMSATRTAMDAVEAGDWDQAENAVKRIKRIVDGDIDRIETTLDPDDDGDAIPTAEELFAYLGGEATIGERFVVAVPDARLKGSEESLAAKLSPAQLVQYLTDGNADRLADFEAWPVSWKIPPRLSASVTIASGGMASSAKLLARDDGETTRIGGVSDPDSDDDGLSDGGEVVRFDHNGQIEVFSWNHLVSWGNEQQAGSAAVTPLIVGSVLAQPEGCPQPMPALLDVKRIRHNGQYLFAGGWIVDDNALYGNATTLLVAGAAPEVATVTAQENHTEMRRTFTSALKRERSKLGSLVYDGALGENALSFLPAGHREGEGRETLAERATQAVGPRNPQTGKEIKIALRDAASGQWEESLQTTVLPLDAPILHIGVPEGCSRCGEKPGCECKTNLVPAVNSISSR